MPWLSFADFGQNSYFAAFSIIYVFFWVFSKTPIPFPYISLFLSRRYRTGSFLVVQSFAKIPVFITHWKLNKMLPFGGTGMAVFSLARNALSKSLWNIYAEFGRKVFAHFNKPLGKSDAFFIGFLNSRELSFQRYFEIFLRRYRTMIFAGFRF